MTRSEAEPAGPSADFALAMLGWPDLTSHQDQSETPNPQRASFAALPPEARRVDLCITELDPGGAERALARLARGLKERGWLVRVISLRDAGAVADEIADDGIPVHHLNCGGATDPRAVTRLRRAFLDDTPRAVISFLHQANMASRFAAALLPGRVTTPKVVCGVRVADRRRAVVLPERMTRRLVDHYTAVSRSVAALHSELCAIPADRMTTICNGVDPGQPVEDRFFEAPEVKPCRVLFVGRLTPQKAPLDLLEAWCLLPEELGDNCRLTIVGTGELESQVRQFVTERLPGRNIELLGRSDEVRNLMRSSDLLVLPSRWEGLPNVVLEAMAEGLPVLATAVDGVTELIPDGNRGWLCPPADPLRLAEAMTAAIRSPQDRRAAALASQVFVAEEFTWDRMSDGYHRLLLNLLSADD